MIAGCLDSLQECGDDLFEAISDVTGPARPNTRHTVVIKLMPLNLIALWDQFGYVVYASVDQRTTSSDGRTDPNTWHCRRSRDSTSDMPIHHN